MSVRKRIYVGKRGTRKDWIYDRTVNGKRIQSVITNTYRTRTALEKTVLRWFDLTSKNRTKQRLLEMLRK